MTSASLRFDFVHLCNVLFIYKVSDNKLIDRRVLLKTTERQLPCFFYNQVPLGYQKLCHPYKSNERKFQSPVRPVSSWLRSRYTYYMDTHSARELVSPAAE